MITVDARGMRCPWPVLRLARAMRESDAARLLADDPAAATEVLALCQARGWSLEQPEPALFVVRNGLSGNDPFTPEA